MVDYLWHVCPKCGTWSPADPSQRLCAPGTVHRVVMCKETPIEDNLAYRYSQDTPKSEEFSIREVELVERNKRTR